MVGWVLCSGRHRVGAAQVTTIDKAFTVAHYQALADAAVNSARAVESVTLYPFIVTLRYTLDGKPQRDVHVIESTMSKRPDGFDLLPKQAENIAADVFPASRFDDMPSSTRQNYSGQYRQYLTWRAARAFGMSIPDLWATKSLDYVELDERVQNWLRPNRYVGD